MTRGMPRTTTTTASPHQASRLCSRSGGGSSHRRRRDTAGPRDRPSHVPAGRPCHRRRRRSADDGAGHLHPEPGCCGCHPPSSSSKPTGRCCRPTRRRPERRTQRGGRRTHRARCRCPRSGAPAGRASQQAVRCRAAWEANARPRTRRRPLVRRLWGRRSPAHTGASSAGARPRLRQARRRRPSLARTPGSPRVRLQCRGGSKAADAGSSGAGKAEATGRGRPRSRRRR